MLLVRVWIQPLPLTLKLKKKQEEITFENDNKTRLESVGKRKEKRY